MFWVDLNLKILAKQLQNWKKNQLGPTTTRAYLALDCKLQTKIHIINKLNEQLGDTIGPSECICTAKAYVQTCAWSYGKSPGKGVEQPRHGNGNAKAGNPIIEGPSAKVKAATACYQQPAY